MSTTISSFTDLDKESLLLVLQALQRVRYDGCQLHTQFDGLRLGDDGNLYAENFTAVDVELERYKATLITMSRPDKSTYRDLVFWENDKGRPNIGDSVVELRLFPNGRYRVRIQWDEYFEDLKKSIKDARLPRSSKPNPLQALKHRAATMGQGGWSNSKRIIGKPIAQHYLELGWGPELKDNDFMDVYEYLDTPDMPGQSTFAKMLKHAPAELADEVYKQIRNRSHVTK